MSRLIYKIFLLVLSLVPTIAYPKEVAESLKDSITCGIDPLGSIRAIAAAGSNFKKGYSAISYGDGPANTVIVTLEKPLEVYGAKSFFVVGVADNSLYFNFNGIVYAKFSGDYRKVVTELNLVEVKGEEIPIGKFQRKLKIDSDGKPYELCPMTIGLTPLENNEFLLGCGWCNG